MKPEDRRKRIAKIGLFTVEKYRKHNKNSIRNTNCGIWLGMACDEIETLTASINRHNQLLDHLAASGVDVKGAAMAELKISKQEGGE